MKESETSVEARLLVGGYLLVPLQASDCMILVSKAQHEDSVNLHGF